MCVVEAINITMRRLSVKIVKSFVNHFPLSSKEFVFYVGCHGEHIKKRRRYLVMADWKVEDNRGRLELVFVKRWGKRMMERLDKWGAEKNKCWK